MVIKQLLQYGAKMLSDNGTHTPKLDASLLLCHVLKKDRSYLIINHMQKVEENDEKEFLSLLQKRADGMPIAYILGKKEFMSLEFEVNENVLIPRADTETLCEYIIENNDKKSPKIADICCGSGAIGVSLAVYIKDSRVTLADISEGALEMAQKNAKKHGVYERCLFEKIDILSENLNEKYDIIVSNPPYIESKVIDTLERDVKDFEPRLALDGGEDGFVFYTHLAKVCYDVLKKDGVIAFEVGHTQAEAVAKMLSDNGFCDVKSICDLANIKRVVCARKRI